MKKYGAIKTFGVNIDEEIVFIDTDFREEEYVNNYYKIIFEVKNIEEFNLKKYTYKGCDSVIVKNVLFKIDRRVSKHRYICENISNKNVIHIPFFSTRWAGRNFYMFYDFHFEKWYKSLKTTN